MDDANPPSSKGSTPEALAELLTQLGQTSLLGLLESAARQATAPSPPATLGNDILHGAAEIAGFLFGHRKHRRRVYNLVERGLLPHFKIGASLCARKSVLLDWIREQERGTTVASSASNN